MNMCLYKLFIFMYLLPFNEMWLLNDTCFKDAEIRPNNENEIFVMMIGLEQLE